MLKGTFAIATLSVCCFMSVIGVSDDPKPEKRVTLIGMFSEWIYPESQFHGAESSDAAVTDISAIQSKAVLTTPDSVEKVMNFYCQKLNVDIEGKNLDGKKGERVTTERSVLIHDDSKERSCTLYVIAVNGTNSSTTVVVSRSDDEDVTHIAWSNYRRLKS